MPAGSVPDTPVNHDWFRQHLALLSATLHQYYQCQSNPKFHIVEMSSPTRGHKAITIDLDMKTLTSLEANGKPVNMDHLPVELPQRFNSASEFLSILNFVANMSLCTSRKSPSCTILMSRRYPGSYIQSRPQVRQLRGGPAQEELSKSKCNL